MFIKILMTPAAWGCWGWAGLGWKLQSLLEDLLPTCVVVIREELKKGLEIFEYIYGWTDTISFKNDSVYKSH